MIVIPILRYHAVTSTVPLSSLPWLVGTCLFWHCDLINRLSKLISGTLCLVSFDLVIHQRKTHSWLILPLRAAPVFRANKILYEQSFFSEKKNLPISKWFNNTYLSTWALFWVNQERIRITSGFVFKSRWVWDQVWLRFVGLMKKEKVFFRSKSKTRNQTEKWTC